MSRTARNLGHWRELHRPLLTSSMMPLLLADTLHNPEPRNCLGQLGLGAREIDSLFLTLGKRFLRPALGLERSLLVDFGRPLGDVGKDRHHARLHLQNAPVDKEALCPLRADDANFAGHEPRQERRVTRRNAHLTHFSRSENHGGLARKKRGLCAYDIDVDRFRHQSDFAFSAASSIAPTI